MSSKPISVGDQIEVQDAEGFWHPKVARSAPYLNKAFVGRLAPWMVAAVDHEGFEHTVNWPLSAVRLASERCTCICSDGVRCSNTAIEGRVCEDCPR